MVPGADRRSRSEAPALITGVMYIIPIYKGQIALGLILLLVTTAGYVLLIVPGVIAHVLTVVNAYGGRVSEEGSPAELNAAAKAQHQRQNGLVAWALGGLAALWLLLMIVAVFTR